MIPVFAAAARYRRMVLLGALLAAVVLSAWEATADGWTWWIPAVGSALLAVTLLVLSLLAGGRYRPAHLVALPREPAFAAPADPQPVLNGAGFTMLAGVLVGDDVADLVRGDDVDTYGIVTVVAFVMLLALLWAVTWPSYGVRLRADGVTDRQPFGRRFIPWDALAADRAATPGGARAVLLAFARPEAVTVRGLARRGEVLASGAEHGYFARVLNEYAAHPEHRPAIGSEAELRRLAAAVS